MAPSDFFHKFPHNWSRVQLEQGPAWTKTTSGSLCDAIEDETPLSEHALGLYLRCVSEYVTVKILASWRSLTTSLYRKITWRPELVSGREGTEAF